MEQRINAEEQVAMIVGVETQEEFEMMIDDRNDSFLESYGCFSKGAGKSRLKTQLNFKLYNWYHFFA